jgi:hypothetical protein
MTLTRRAALVGATALATSAYSMPLASDPAIIAIEKATAATKAFQSACNREFAAEAGFEAEMGRFVPVLKVDGFSITSAEDLGRYQADFEPHEREQREHNVRILRERIAGIVHPPGSLRLGHSTTREQKEAWEQHCAGVRQQFAELKQTYAEAKLRWRLKDLEDESMEALGQETTAENEALHTIPTSRAGALALLAFTAQYLDSDLHIDDPAPCATAIRNCLKLL